MRFFRRILPLLLAVIVLCVTIPSVSAFESSKVNIRAHVMQGSSKTLRLATCTEISAAHWQYPGQIPPGCNLPWITDPYYVPIYTLVFWIVTITVQNPLDETIHDVMVFDIFPADITGRPLSSTSGFFFYTINPVNNKLSITWYPDNIPAEGNESITILMWTDMNPSGCKWEYTAVGPHIFNKGATIIYKDEDNNVYTENTGTVEVIAYDPTP